MIVIDELHLMLRVSDILIRNMVWAMAAMDHRRETHERLSPVHMDKLVAAVNQCGISFQVGSLYTVHIQFSCFGLFTQCTIEHLFVYNHSLTVYL